MSREHTEAHPTTGSITATKKRKSPSGTHEQLDQSAVVPILGYSLAQAAVAMRQVFNRAVGDSLQLRPVEFTVLQLLFANRNVTQTQLARTLAMSAPNLTILLDRLAARGLLARERSDKDRRERHLRLKPEARALARKTVELVKAAEDEALRHLSTAERAILLELLQRVARHRSS
jgi:DNA-binding MarR family transcriptional regulator